MKRDHVKLICDVGELTGLFADTMSMESFLQRIVEMIAQHMNSEVCSIYLFYEESEELILKATKGLSPNSINTVKLKVGEGLTGKSLAERHAICEGRAKDNPNFKYFPGINEEQYESFLAVPILRGNIRIGVIVIQSLKPDYFTQEDVQVFRAITSQLANTIEMAKLLMTLDEKKHVQPAVKAVLGNRMFKGRVGSEGAAYAPCMVLEEDNQNFLSVPFAAGRTYGLDDFYAAVGQTQAELETFQHQIEETLFDVASLIFAAQILMLKDKGFTEAIAELIRHGYNAPVAIKKVIEGYVHKFEKIEDAYLRDKIHDVKDVGKRLLENLAGISSHNSEYENKIIIARELLPSDALKLFSQKVKGLILLSGGVSSHLSILARSLNIPLIIADEPRLLELAPLTPVLLDARIGHVYIEPSRDVIAKVEEREDVARNMTHMKSKLKSVPQTKDGVRVKLLANINLLGDVKAANEFGAEGVGLYRTEFPFLVRSNFPTEEEQYQIYRRLVEGMGGKEVTFRTLDIGGDKIIPYYDYSKEENPFLGLRSIRFSLRHKDVFEQQIKAILRAGAGSKIGILFPMVSSLDELTEAKEAVQRCIAELRREGKTFNEHPRLGIMIELPAVLEILDELAQEVDFFSIGTNDFIQYMLAVDRTNEKVADLYLPYHPAVLRGLKKIVDAGGKYNKDVSVCGDMAHDTRYLTYLLGIGVRLFSLDARYLPKIHEKLSEISLKEAEETTGKILSESRIANVAKFLLK